MFRMERDGTPGLFGIAGSLDYWPVFRHWLLNDVEPPPTPRDSNHTIICIQRNGMVWVRSNAHYGWQHMGKIKWAIGSGADYALGAMLHGASAAEAVRISSKLDESTGKGVDVVRF